MNVQFYNNLGHHEEHGRGHGHGHGHEHGHTHDHLDDAGMFISNDYATLTHTRFHKVNSQNEICQITPLVILTREVSLSGSVGAYSMYTLPYHFTCLTADIQSCRFR
jgi:hypothetical protein